MEVIKNKNAKEFLELNEEVLLKNESINNLILGLADSLARGTRKASAISLFTVKDKNKIVGQALQTDLDKPLSITQMSDSSIDFLIDTLAKEGLKLLSVVGPQKTSRYFATKWSEKLNVENKLSMAQGVYELLEVKDPDYRGGKLIHASEEHKNIVTPYVLGFLNDCFPEENNEKELNSYVERLLSNQGVYLWSNPEGHLVSMACKNRESRNATTVSLVYTPKHLRGKGYGSCVVASLSKRILQEGKQKCNLFTDLSNPTSNSIYQKVGYFLVGHSAHYRFLYKKRG